MRYRHLAWIPLLIALAAMSVLPARGQGPAPEEEPAAEAPAEMAPMRPDDPAVEAILATQPTTPAELVRAAKILADLDRPDLAKRFLKQVLDANLDEQQLVALEALYGAGMFTRMAARDDLAPEARQLNEAVLAAVTRHVRDPARLAGLVGQLQAPTPEARYQALVELRRAGSAAVAPLMAVLADPNRAAEHANARAALVELGSRAVDPLIAMLESGDAKLTAQAIGVLADIGSREAIVFLQAPFVSEESDPQVRQAAAAALVKLTGRTPSRQEAARLLAQRAEEHFERRRPLDADLEGEVELWIWDGDARQAVAVRRPAEEASLLLASRLARDAFSVAPQDEAVRLLYLATMLEEAAYRQGLETPVPVTEGSPAGRAAEFGPEVIEEVLAYALETGRAPAATAAVRILGRLGSAETLLHQGARPGPLARATWDADRRVRTAAVEAIVELEPTQPFPGASRVAEALVYFASSNGAPRALIAGPSIEENMRIGGYLANLGYQIDTATNGRDVIRSLLASPDYELALLDANLQKPTVDLLLQELRQDCRTAKLPVGLTARDGQLPRARVIARPDPLAEAFPRPHTEEAVQWQVSRLMRLLGQGRVSRAERDYQAAQAMKWLARLTGQERTIYDLSRAEEAATTALFVPGLAADAVAVLGNLGTPQCQQALVDLASRWSQPLELRVAAVRAFRKSTERRGILLTTEQILRQYDRYNQSQSLDAGTQQVLGLILDSIEAPTRTDEPETGRAAPDRSGA